MTKLQLFLWLPPAAVHLATSAPLHYYYNIYHYNRNDFNEARLSGFYYLNGFLVPRPHHFHLDWLFGKGHR